MAGVPQKPEPKNVGISSEEIRRPEPGPAGRVPVRKDRAAVEAAGRLPLRVKVLLLVHVLWLRSMLRRRVPEVSAGVREGGDGIVRVDGREAGSGGGCGILLQGLGHPAGVVFGVEPGIDGDAPVAAPAC